MFLAHTMREGEKKASTCKINGEVARAASEEWGGSRVVTRAQRTARAPQPCAHNTSKAHL